MINDALDLRTLVFDELKDASRADQWPRMVDMAERQLNQLLRTTWQATTATITVASNTATLPSDYLEMIRVGDGTRHWTEVNNADYSPLGAYTYAIDGATISMTGVDGDISIRYYAALPSLANDLTATNWLLINAPDVYLYAILRNTVGGDYEGMFMRAMSGMKSASDRRRYGNSNVRINAV